MKEDYVSYELAVKLQAAGFDEPCDHYYMPNGVLHIVKTNALAPEITNNRFLEEIDCRCCTAAPLWQAQKWLREVRNIDVLVYNCACGYLWDVSKAGNEQTHGTTLVPYDEEGDDEARGCWLSYEGALSAGLSKALELLTQNAQ